MLQAILIGNIGADAQIQVSDGREFISFRVAHNDTYTDAQGNKVERSMWVDCTLNCANGKPAVFDYLKQGTLVCVTGSLSTRVYSSAKDRCMKAGLKVNVAKIELLGGQADIIPRRLYTKDGVMVDVNKFYNVNDKNTVLVDTRGREYDVDEHGWVTIKQEQQEQAQ